MKKIKSVKAFTSSTNDDFDEYLSSIIEYDALGSVIHHASYLNEDEIESKVVSKYNEKGWKMEETTYMDEEDISEHIVYERDENGKILRELRSYADGSESIKTYNYEGNIIKTLMVDDEGFEEEKEEIHLNENQNIILKLVYEEAEIKEKTINEFDEQARLTKTTEYGRKEEFLQERTTSYDNAGNVAQRVSRNRKGEVIDYTSMKYDEQNRLVENKIGSRYTIHYHFNDEEKSLTEERFLGNGALHEILVSKFNDDNLIAEEIHGLSKIRYEYEFWQ
jgi:hypothetical protein